MILFLANHLPDLIINSNGFYQANFMKFAYKKEVHLDERFEFYAFK